MAYEWKTLENQMYLFHSRLHCLSRRFVSHCSLRTKGTAYTLNGLETWNRTYVSSSESGGL